MHKSFIDKRRRHLNLREQQVENVLPEHFRQYYPKFITLLESYYEWQNEQKSTELISHLFATRDINETDLTLLSFIEDELLLGESYFEGFGQSEAEKRAAANFSNILFRSKGSRFAIEWFFRSFYGLDAEVSYTKENIFKTNDDESRVGADSLRYLTNDELYQTFALLIRVGVPISKWRDIFKQFAHPAGMFLGGEVLLASDDTVPTFIADSDAELTVRLSKDYTITPDANPVNEGDTSIFTVTGTNIPDGIDAIYAYVDHVTTSDSDFPLAVPTQAEPLLVNIDGSSATFSLRTWIDLDTTLDSATAFEQYYVNLVDLENRPLSNVLMTVNNQVSTFELGAYDSAAGTQYGGDTVAEGDPLVFKLTGTNVPYDGNYDMRWYITHSSSVDSDFIYAGSMPDSAGSAELISMSNGVGLLPLRTILDSDTGSEAFRIDVIDELNAIRASIDMTLTETTPVLSVAVETDVVEGESGVISFESHPSEIGDLFRWTITGPDSDVTGRIIAASESFTTTQAGGARTFGTIKSDAYEGSTTATITLENLVTGQKTYDTFGILDAQPEYTIFTDVSNAGEGDDVQFKIGGANIVPSTDVFFEILHGTTNDADFDTVPPQTGTRLQVTVSDVGDNLYLAGFSTNSDTANEKFTARIFNQTTGGTLLASQEFTIRGTAVTYTMVPDVVGLDEGDTVTFTFTTNQADGLYYWWCPQLDSPTSNISQSDFQGFSGSQPYTIHPNADRGTLYVQGGTGGLMLQARDDLQTEGPEEFQIFVSTSQNPSVLPVVESSTVTLNDTSGSTYTLSVADIIEGEQIVAVLNSSTPNLVETWYYETTGAGVVARCNIPQVSITGSAGAVGLSTTATEAAEGDQIGTVTVSRGNYASLGGTVLATDTFTMSDTAPDITVTPTTLTPDEGDQITFSVAGTTIVDGTYYWKDASVVSQVVNPSVISGQSIVYLDNTSGLALGMSVKPGVSGITGTITSITSTYVVMSSPATAGVSAGQVAHFAPAENWEDADNLVGSFTITSNNGTFQIQFLVNADTQDDTFNVGVYTFSGDSRASVLAETGNMTIQNTTAAPVLQAPIVPAPSIVNQGTSAIASISFRPDGRVTSSSLSNPSSTALDRGDWVDNPALLTNPSAYEVYAQIVGAQTGLVFTGPFGVYTNLGSSVTYSMTANPALAAGTSKTTTILFFYREITDSNNSAGFTSPFTVNRVSSTGGGGGGCFIAGTKVLMRDGTTRNIEDVTQGMSVIGNYGEINKVIKRYDHPVADRAIYTINGGDIVTTDAHPILTSEGWKSFNPSVTQEQHPEMTIVGRLTIGDTLIKYNSDRVKYTTTLDSVTSRTEQVDVYNLDVAGNNTFLVNEFVVHNK